MWKIRQNNQLIFLIKYDSFNLFYFEKIFWKWNFFLLCIDFADRVNVDHPIHKTAIYTWAHFVMMNKWTSAMQLWYLWAYQDRRIRHANGCSARVQAAAVHRGHQAAMNWATKVYHIITPHQSPPIWTFNKHKFARPPAIQTAQTITINTISTITIIIIIRSIKPTVQTIVYVRHHCPHPMRASSWITAMRHHENVGWVKFLFFIVIACLNLKLFSFWTSEREICPVSISFSSTGGDKINKQ